MVYACCVNAHWVLCPKRAVIAAGSCSGLLAVVLSTSKGSSPAADGDGCGRGVEVPPLSFLCQCGKSDTKGM